MRLTLLVKLAAMLNDTRLAVARSRLVALVEIAIASEVLAAVGRTGGAGESHVLHAHGEHVSAVGWDHRRTSSRGDLRLVGTGEDRATIVAVGSHANRGRQGRVTRADRGRLRGLRHVLAGDTSGAEGGGITMKSTLDRVEVGRLVAGANVAVVRELAVVTDGTGRNATDAGVVVVEMLLSVVVGARSVLNGRDVVGREGALKLGRGGQHAVAGGRNDGTVVGHGVSWGELEIEGMADRGRS
jgi:hypothetical protein